MLHRDTYGLDYKSYYMGMMGLDTWESARGEYLPAEFIPDVRDFPKTHHALADAKQQAEIFRRMRNYQT